MKNPQGREAKKPKKAKVKAPTQSFGGAARPGFPAPKTDIDSNEAKH